MSRLRAFSAPDLVPSDSGSITSSPTRTIEHQSHEDSGLEGKSITFTYCNKDMISRVFPFPFCARKQSCDLRRKKLLNVFLLLFKESLRT